MPHSCWPRSNPPCIRYQHALDVVSRAASGINEGMERRENLARILAIQAKERLQLEAPGRRLLKEGELQKVCFLTRFLIRA